MKYIVIFVVSIIVFPCLGCKNIKSKKSRVNIMAIEDKIFKEADFAIYINLKKSEKSKDSHEENYYISVIEDSVSYEYFYFGYPDNKEAKESYVLNSQNIKKIQDCIKKEKLNNNKKESKKTGNMGLSIWLNLKMKFKGKIYKIEISGMYNDWSKRGREHTSNLKNLELYSTIE